MAEPAALSGRTGPRASRPHRAGETPAVQIHAGETPAVQIKDFPASPEPVPLARFSAAPDLRTAVRQGAGDLERMERELADLEASHRVTEREYAELQHRFEIRGGYTLDQRIDEAIQLLRSKQQPDGTWLLENTHPGKVHFMLEDGAGRPSRWNTLRALRVLRWYEQSGG